MPLFNKNTNKLKFENRVDILVMLPDFMLIAIIALSLICSILFAILFDIGWLFFAIFIPGIIIAFLTKFFMELAIAPIILNLTYLKDINNQLSNIQNNVSSKIDESIDIKGKNI